MVIVEDAVAAEFCRAVLGAVDRPLVSMVTFKYAASGESGVRRAMADLRDTADDDFGLAAALDGDQRVKDSGSEQENLEYLIGTAAPEVELRNATDSWRGGARAEWEVPLEGGATRLKLALERLDGEDHHDWLHLLGREYGSRAKVIDAFTGLLLLDPGALEAATTLAERVRRRLRQTSA